MENIKRSKATPHLLAAKIWGKIEGGSGQRFSLVTKGFRQLELEQPKASDVRVHLNIMPNGAHGRECLRHPPLELMHERVNDQIQP